MLNYQRVVLRPPNQKQHTTASGPGLADFMWGSPPRRHQLGPFLKFGHLTQLVPETSGLVPEYFEVLFVGEQSGSIPNETLCKTQVILGKFKQQSYVYLWKDFSGRQVQHNSVWMVYTKGFIHTCIKIKLIYTYMQYNKEIFTFWSQCTCSARCFCSRIAWSLVASLGIGNVFLGYWANTKNCTSWLPAATYLPFGKRLHHYGKSQWLMGKSTINGHVQ